MDLDKLDSGLENIWEKHISVLLNELVNSITIFDDKKNIIIDCTLGKKWF